MVTHFQDVVVPPIFFRTCSSALTIPMDDWVRQSINDAVESEDLALSDDFEIYLHQNLYEIGSTDDFTAL